MCGFPLSAIVISLIGALVARVVARALGLPARIVVGIGPRIGAADREPGPIEVRPIPLWVRTHLRDPQAPRASWVRASQPLAMALVPFSVLVIAIMLRGVDEPTQGPPMIVGEVSEGLPAARAGIQPGDVILTVGGEPITDLGSLRAAVQDRAGLPTIVSLQRDGEMREVELVPERADDRALIGISAVQTRRGIGPIDAVGVAGSAIARLTARLFGAASPGDAGALASPIAFVSAPEMDTITTVTLLAIPWSTIALFWALIASIVEVVSALRARTAR